MTTKIVTTLIAGTLLAGSAAAVPPIARCFVVFGADL